MLHYWYSHNRFLKLWCEPVIHFKEDTMLKDQYMSSEITAGFANAIFMRICQRQSHLIPENKKSKWILLNCNYPLVRKFSKFYCLYNWNDLLLRQHGKYVFGEYLQFLHGIINLFSWKKSILCLSFMIKLFFMDNDVTWGRVIPSELG